MATVTDSPLDKKVPMNIWEKVSWHTSGDDGRGAAGSAILGYPELAAARWEHWLTGMNCRVPMSTTSKHGLDRWCSMFGASIPRQWPQNEVITGYAEFST